MAKSCWALSGHLTAKEKQGVGNGVHCWGLGQYKLGTQSLKKTNDKSREEGREGQEGQGDHSKQLYRAAIDIPKLPHQSNLQMTLSPNNLPSTHHGISTLLTGFSLILVAIPYDQLFYIQGMWLYKRARVTS